MIPAAAAGRANKTAQQRRATQMMGRMCVIGSDSPVWKSDDPIFNIRAPLKCHYDQLCESEYFADAIGGGDDGVGRRGLRADFSVAEGNGRRSARTAQHRRFRAGSGRGVRRWEDYL